MLKSKPIAVTHLATSISREACGLFDAVRHLSFEVSRHNVAVEILGLEDRFSQEDLPAWKPLPVYIYPSKGPHRFAWSPGLSRHLANSATDIIHLQCLWQYPSLAVLRWARQTRKPHLVSPHGMLESWALNHSRYRKLVIGWLFQNSCLREAACLRATADSEVESIRQAGLRNPVAMIRNGVAFPAVLPQRKTPPEKCRKKALFVSRIHPKKGLLNLVGAWARIKKTDAGRELLAEWQLELVGPDENGHLAEVMNAVRACGLERQIVYRGEIWNESAKLECYASADLFVLPTFSENFGLVIAEALSCGVPVITTRAAPWAELATHRCGWWIETGEEPLFRALQTALAIPVETLREMGRRGRNLIEAKYSWQLPGRQMAEVYEWLLGRRAKPECVI